MTNPLDNIAQTWARQIVRQLVASGVKHFFVSPGSRSTPLVLAILESEISCTVHYDERGSAFAAVGFARSSGSPAAWVTTSGTAVANGFPSVVEAAESRVPLVLLTADRPPELRYSGANQTIDQVKIFGSYVRAFVDVPAPDPQISMMDLHQMVSGALQAAVYPVPGPVHINCMFRKPLEPQDGQNRVSQNPGHDLLQPAFVPPRLSPDDETVLQLSDALKRSKRPMIAVGTTHGPEEAKAIVALSRTVNSPVLADIRSGLRDSEYMESDRVVGSHELILKSASDKLERPDLLIEVGERLTSSAFYTYSADDRIERFHVSPASEKVNPSRVRQHSIICDVSILMEKLDAGGAASHPDSADYASCWISASKRISDVLDKHRAVTTNLTEPSVARALSVLTPHGFNILAASSMPVRDMDSFSAGLSEPHCFFANRGASGIDGLIATAFGLSRGNGNPTAVLIGDLALLHDLNSLGLLNNDVHVIIVTINNNGGGIFSFLPIAEHERYFERGFGTPHGLGFRQAADMFGLRYENPQTLAEFKHVYAEAVDKKGVYLIEIVTDRKENMHVHNGIIEDCRRALTES
ncbi:MAG: 2-succinyl-5-enolpyruvyl-6-hydroxy-3-cyclohexene-1-carboxylic-acid synthase [Rhodothermales bacterium]|nr:2-succinyl-5-enolpyruvyl-6-hydroxy-3-cyclohexene-1-carboxylic-acid synthase [Rhodothermales bacterium]